MENNNAIFLNNLNVLRENIWKLHWNLIGPIFIPTHRWLGEQYDEVAEYVDTFAEHLKGLGGNPLSEIPKEDYRITPIKSQDIEAFDALQNLKREYDVIKKMNDEMIRKSNEAGDFAGEDTHYKFSTFLDKSLYFIKQTLK